MARDVQIAAIVISHCNSLHKSIIITYVLLQITYHKQINFYTKLKL